MDIEYRPGLKAQVAIDDDGLVRHVIHIDEHWQPTAEDPRGAAIEYLREHAGVRASVAPEDALESGDATLDVLDEPVSYTDPREEGDAYRFLEEKRQFDSTTVAFAQTHLGVPVWRTGITVTVKGDHPPAVVESTSTTRSGVEASLPAAETIRQWRDVAVAAERRGPEDSRSVGEGGDPGGAEGGGRAADALVRDALGLSGGRDGALGQGAVDEGAGERGASVPDGERLRVGQGRFYVYRYDPDQRQPRAYEQKGGAPVDLEVDDVELTFPLPPVPESIEVGQDYLVSEVVFTLPYAGFDRLNWRALVEVETNAVLWLRALISGVNGLVFVLDPITSTGVLTNDAGQPNGTLDPLRDDVLLEHLVGPAGGMQALSGTNVILSDDDTPTVAPPSEATGTDFDYTSRTDDFAAVNAYFHANGFFAIVESLGFDRDTYFDGTTFPVHVDHRAHFGDPNGIEINAFCSGDAQGDGIGLVGYCLAHLGDTTNPLGRAVDKYVHWHEIGGHGILWDHVDSPNFGFAHSAGDGLAGVQSDPESMLRELGFVERFRYTPFRPIRWMNRDVASGWGWGGSEDLGGYNSEQILATCHFRIYRSIGGDSPALERRRLASRVVTYLVLRTVGDLTPMTNPATAGDWCARLIATDAFDWTTEGLVGGAYHKVIRWAFEQQGLFRSGGAPTTDPGAPPAVDVYINDGRAGTYLPHLTDAQFAATPDIWNRRLPDHGTTHEEPLAGFPSYCYVRVSNRGTGPAADPSVRLLTADPAGGLEWPSDWTPAATPILAASGPIASGGDVVVGPFSWSAATNGAVALLGTVSATGDASNADTITAPIAHWRLVPNDNNVAQRDMVAETANACDQIRVLADWVAGLGLAQGLTASLRAKLRNARKSCTAGHDNAACGQLGAFDNQVQAKTGKGITAAQATVLLGHSAGIQSVLGC